jgi:hypothetical protein
MEIQYKSYQPKNNYMFKIQELYKYQYLLQEITKELNSLVKNNDELEKLTTNIILFYLSHFYLFSVGVIGLVSNYCW